MTKSLREIGYNDEGKINGRQAARIKRAMRRNTNKSFLIRAKALKKKVDNQGKICYLSYRNRISPKDQKR